MDMKAEYSKVELAAETFTVARKITKEGDDENEASSPQTMLTKVASSTLPPLPMLGGCPVTFSCIKTGIYAKSIDDRFVPSSTYGDDNKTASTYNNHNNHPESVTAQHFSPMYSDREGSSCYPFLHALGNEKEEWELEGTETWSQLHLMQRSFSRANYFDSSSLLSAGYSSYENLPPPLPPPLVMTGEASLDFSKNKITKRKRDEQLSSVTGIAQHYTIVNSSTQGQSSGINLLCNVSVNFGSRLEVGCKCTRSRCLKLYCDCFQSGKVCIPTCACSNCFNTKEESGENGERTKG